MRSPNPLVRRLSLIAPLIGALVTMIAQIRTAEPWRGAGGASAGDVLISVLLFVWALAPYAVIVVLLVKLHQAVALWWAVAISAVILAVMGIATDVSILTSDSSTAPIGFIVVPIAQFTWLGIALAIAAVITAVRTSRSGPAPSNPR